MKKIILLLSMLLFVSAAQAKTIRISVDNRSDEPITIQKHDGLLSVPAHTIIENQIFLSNELVTNYVDGKKRCTWDLRKVSRREFVNGIFYSAAEEFTPGCITIVTPRH